MNERNRNLRKKLEAHGNVKHVNPLTGLTCGYNPECPICEERSYEHYWEKKI